jgi:UDP-N-acetyl-D-glucosamine dehydrogenase
VGWSYKRNSGDARQSPAIAVARRLADLGADLHAVDPVLAAVDAPPGVQLVSCTHE